MQLKCKIGPDDNVFNYYLEKRQSTASKFFARFMLPVSARLKTQKHSCLLIQYLYKKTCILKNLQ